MRKLNHVEQYQFLENRDDILAQAQELYDDFKCLSNIDLCDNRECMQNRVKFILELCLETEEDNLDEK